MPRTTAMHASTSPPIITCTVPLSGSETPR